MEKKSGYCLGAPGFSKAVHAEGYREADQHGAGPSLDLGHNLLKDRSSESKWRKIVTP